MIEIRIGLIDSPKEVSLELDETSDNFKDRIDSSVSKEEGLFWMTDHKGKQVGVAANKITYVEIEPEAGARSVGFATGA